MRKGIQTITAAAASLLLLGAGATAASAVEGHESRAALGPCNSPQAIKFSNSGVNGGYSKIQNCFSTNKRVAFRIHKVVFPISWDKTGGCSTLRPGASVSMRNATSSYGFSYVAC